MNGKKSLKKVETIQKGLRIIPLFTVILLVLTAIPMSEIIIVSADDPAFDVDLDMMLNVIEDDADNDGLPNSFEENCGRMPVHTYTASSCFLQEDAKIYVTDLYWVKVHAIGGCGAAAGDSILEVTFGDELVPRISYLTEDWAYYEYLYFADRQLEEGSYLLTVNAVNSIFDEVTVERENGLNWLDADSDDDGILDGDEMNNYLTNPINPDSDDDGLKDGLELGFAYPSDYYSPGCFRGTPVYPNGPMDAYASYSDWQSDSYKHTDDIRYLQGSSGYVDTDVTTTSDPLDPDSDGDGILDGEEDVDHDGAVDADETDPNDMDSDDDGILECAEGYSNSFWWEDLDGDNLCNAVDMDSDGDGIDDGIESGLTVGDVGPYTDLGVFVPDLDPTTTTDPVNIDSDFDGLSDGTEDVNGNGMCDTGETDAADDDTDDDLAIDGMEIQYGIDPLDMDSDDDGVLDGSEGYGSVNWWDDSDGTGGVNANDQDSDGDGIHDGCELGLNETHVGADTDLAFFIGDFDNGTTVTDPLLLDSDLDGIEDGMEDINFDGAKEEGETDAADDDTDYDGIIDGTELTYDLDPIDWDSDDDGIADGDEGYGTANWWDNTDGTGGINALDPDSDDDGLGDLLETEYRYLSPLSVDADGDGHCDYDEYYYWEDTHQDLWFNDLDYDGEYTTGCYYDPLPGYSGYEIIGASDSSKDHDGDGLEDEDEIDIYGTDPANTDTDGDGYDDDEEVNIHGTDPTTEDGDEDGLTDMEEVLLGTDPYDEDTDGDGLEDGIEVEGWEVGAITQDGYVSYHVTSNPLDATDRDGDGLNDLQEYEVSENVDYFVGYGTDPDEDDTDEDGLLDGEEVYHQDITDWNENGNTIEMLGGWFVTVDLNRDGDCLDSNVVVTENGVQTSRDEHYRVNPNPLDFNCDEDTLTDYQERWAYKGNQDPSNDDVEEFFGITSASLIWSCGTDPFIRDTDADGDYYTYDDDTEEYFYLDDGIELSGWKYDEEWVTWMMDNQNTGFNNE